MTPDEIATAAIKQSMAEFEKLFSRIQPKEVQKVVTIDKPSKFSLTEIDRASTNAQARPSEPNLEFANPRDKETNIDEISIVPDATFRSKGMVEIQVNDAPVYRTKTAGAFTDVGDDDTVFKRGKLVNGGDRVKVFIWNGVDNNTVALTVKTTFGEVIE